jgi:hypothetical protein
VAAAKNEVNQYPTDSTRQIIECQFESYPINHSEITNADDGDGTEKEKGDGKGRRTCDYRNERNRRKADCNLSVDIQIGASPVELGVGL